MKKKKPKVKKYGTKDTKIEEKKINRTMADTDLPRNDTWLNSSLRNLLYTRCFLRLTVVDISVAYFRCYKQLCQNSVSCFRTTTHGRSFTNFYTRVYLHTCNLFSFYLNFKNLTISLKEETLQL